MANNWNWFQFKLTHQKYHLYRNINPVGALFFQLSLVRKVLKQHFVNCVQRVQRRTMKPRTTIEYI